MTTQDAPRLTGPFALQDLTRTGHSQFSIDYALEIQGDVSALIAEPMRWTTVEAPPPEFWPQVKDSCRRHGALLIFDEIPSCLARTGTLYACEQFGATPDILVQPIYGTIYTASTVKNEEHGGFSFADTNVGLIVSNPGIEHQIVKSPVATSQVAATIIKALGIDPSKSSFPLKARSNARFPAAGSLKRWLPRGSVMVCICPQPESRWKPSSAAAEDS